MQRDGGGCQTVGATLGLGLPRGCLILSASCTQARLGRGHREALGQKEGLCLGHRDGMAKDLGPATWQASGQPWAHSEPSVTVPGSLDPAGPC